MYPFPRAHRRVRDAASCEARTAAGTDNANVEALAAPHILVVWSSQTNHTKNLAAAIAKGAGDAGGSVRLKHATDATFAGDVKNWSDCSTFGTTAVAFYCPRRGAASLRARQLPPGFLNMVQAPVATRARADTPAPTGCGYTPLRTSGGNEKSSRNPVYICLLRLLN